MKKIMIIILILLTLVANPIGVIANVRDYPFDRENTDFQISGAIYGLATNNDGTIVAVGQGGVILTHNETWGQIEKVTEQTLKKAYWFDDRFFAVGGSGTLLQSKDGLTWEKNIVGSNIELYGMTKGSQGYVLSGDKGTMFFSEDLKRWNKYEMSKKNVTLKSICWDGSSYVAVGCIDDKLDKRGIVYLSSDGVKWYEVFVAQEESDFIDIAFDGSQFIIISSFGTVWKSIDKVNWEKQVLYNLQIPSMSQQLYSIYWSGISYIVCGERVVLVSTDAITWKSIAYDACFFSTIWDGARYIFATESIFFTYSPDDVIKIIYNNKPIIFKDVAPQIISNRTMIPVRGLFEKMGATILWDDNKNEVIVKIGDSTIILGIDSQEAWVNGIKKTMDVPTKIINNRTFIPLRFVSENINKRVDWEAATNTVRITENQ